jgi:hypothetical protein
MEITNNTDAILHTQSREDSYEVTIIIPKDSKKSYVLSEEPE